MKKKCSVAFIKINLNHFKSVHLRLILIALGSFFVITSSLLYLWTAKKAEEVLFERFAESQLTLAKAGALSISQLFAEKKADLLLLAEIQAIKAGEEEGGRLALKSAVDQMRDGPFASLVRVDKTGKSLWSDNVDHIKVEEGIDLSDRDYFLWAREQKSPGEVFVGKSNISRGGITQGKWIVVMATPVFYREEFNGLVFISFLLADFTEKYISPLAFSPQVKSILVNSEGIIVASNIPEAQGRKVSETMEQNNWGDEMVTAIAPINKIEEGRVWSLWVSVPRETVISVGNLLFSNQTRVFVIAIFFLIIFALVFLLGVRVSRKEGFLDGFQNGAEFKKKV